MSTERETPKCGQYGCTEQASHRFTWPGRDESFICDKHLPKVREVASAIGMYLQIIPLENEQ